MFIRDHEKLVCKYTQTDSHVNQHSPISVPWAPAPGRGLMSVELHHFTAAEPITFKSLQLQCGS